MDLSSFTDYPGCTGAPAMVAAPFHNVLIVTDHHSTDPHISQVRAGRPEREVCFLGFRGCEEQSLFLGLLISHISFRYLVPRGLAFMVQDS